MWIYLKFCLCHALHEELSDERAISAARVYFIIHTYTCTCFNYNLSLIISIIFMLKQNDGYLWLS